MSEKLTEWLLGWLKPLYTLHALLAWLVVLLLLFSGINPFLTEFLPLRWLYYFYIFVFVCFFASWFWGRFRIPRGRKNKLNVVIAIATEYDPAGELLKSDLLKQLKRSLNGAEFADMTNIVEFPNHFAEKVEPAMLKKWNKKIRAQMWVWGRARNRNGQVYLDLEGWVIHTPIPIKASRDLANDFRAALPKRIQFSEEVSFQGSEITANLIYYTALYITGVAALISGDPDWALRTHTQLKQELEALLEIPLNIQTISRKIPHVMSDAHIVKGIVKLNQSDSEGAKNELNAAFDLRRNNYSALILKSVIEFRLDNDPASSLKTIDEAERCSGNDGTWLYNKVFLLLYTKDYTEALRLLKSLERHERENDINISGGAISFTEKLIAGNNAPPAQLYFWMGFLSYKKLADLPTALRYLEEFHEKADDSMQILKERSEAWLVGIKAKMQLL